jgi:hypothetical protein
MPAASVRGARMVISASVVPLVQQIKRKRISVKVPLGDWALLTEFAFSKSAS